ncbi:MAG: aspartate/glutamate racemase family protein [Rhodanobacter sp.]
MRTIGLIGGMSWESTATYYQLINRGVRDRTGPLRSARVLIDSLDFGVVEALQRAGDWDRAGELLAQSACRLQAGGADGVLLATNTMHKVADAVIRATPLPFLHIVDPTGVAIRAAGIETVALLGTAFTMEEDFYRSRLHSNYGVQCIVPSAEHRKQVHRIIYEELCVGVISDASRQVYREVIADCVAKGAHAVILGCTEIGLLVSQNDSPVPLFDTTALHAAAAVDFVLAG